MINFLLLPLKDKNRAAEVNFLKKLMMKKIVLILVFFPLLVSGQTLVNYNIEYIKKIYVDI